MKIIEIIDIIESRNISESEFWEARWNDIEDSITAIDWPHGSGSFSLNPTEKHKNGVKPIKIPAINLLKSRGWRVEKLPKQLAGAKMGNLDALYENPKLGNIGFEWETGNISSSHRAINKMLLALLKKGLIAGVLVVPSESMRPYITDRIGNINELREYFFLWNKLQIGSALLRIVSVEYDALDPEVDFIPKGFDGMAKR
ncbi:hypothetical protein AWQ21_01880 [Picosynechococcus sp. PCC 7003]|uniref:hypothetical protein n=1 Tax=Picosynechococcus sp. PCC 7003 TaxID=374981 RepID=UPI00081061B1|nr:hypothetical protein [Picosynechococcus sp. PCC 7003]ANV83241.1 hypothetical protein AWQ21_01880 [Picosynechococcus sp. PCC 7003]